MLLEWGENFGDQRRESLSKRFPPVFFLARPDITFLDFYGKLISFGG